jgi:hypothetical protein
MRPAATTPPLCPPPSFPLFPPRRAPGVGGVRGKDTGSAGVWYRWGALGPACQGQRGVVLRARVHRARVKATRPAMWAMPALSARARVCE